MSHYGNITADDLEARLGRHLKHRLGAWPPSGGLEVVASENRDLPEWDGVVRPIAGVETPDGMVLSVPPAVVVEVAELASHGLTVLFQEIGAVFGQEGTSLGTGTFRFIEHLVDLEELGEWVESDDPRLPSWLRPFNGGILIACDDRDRYMAGVGVKRHDEFGSEIAVGTEPEFRGRGLARRLVATAARYLVGTGVTVTYEHVIDNAASGAVALAAGFPDRGWQAVHLGHED
jgi:GNAT superfamily N-acetyltransferase